jgi:hypothetical protein
MIPFALWGTAILLPVLIWFFFRKGGYKRTPLDAPPGQDWQATGERFVDPTSGETLEVWFHAASGKRAYVRARPQGT